MKGYTREDFEDHLPHQPALEAVRYCLEQLYADKHKDIHDVCAGHLKYEDLIGTLRLAEKSILHEQELFERDTVSFHTT
jgi:hypothetical protein